MRYMLPRLQTFMTTGAGMDAKGGVPGGGGGGLKGAGESQLEADKRLFRKQLQRLEAEMDEVRASASSTERSGASATTSPWCDSRVHERRQVDAAEHAVRLDRGVALTTCFATVDPTTRRVRPPVGRRCSSPTRWASSRSCPPNSPGFGRRSRSPRRRSSCMWSTRRRRRTPAGVVGAEHHRGARGRGNAAGPCPQQGGRAERLAAQSLGVGGRHERVTPAYAVMTREAPRVGRSLRDGSARFRLAVRVECRVPYAAGELLAEVHKTGTVVEAEYEPAGTRVVAFVPPSLRNRLKRYSLE